MSGAGEASALPLSAVTKAELESLRKAIAKRQVMTPLTAVGLTAIARGGLVTRIGPLLGLGTEAALAMIDLALATRGDGAAPGAQAVAAELVWTEPGAPAGASARTTTAAVLELLARAHEEVVIVGYEFDHGAVLFGPLHAVMTSRGVKARICVDVRPAPSPRSHMAAYLAVEAQRFIDENWPFGAPLPEVWHLRSGCAHDARHSLHAKCIVVDGRYVLIGSANFTRRGHQRNLEVGVRVDDRGLARALLAEIDRLHAAGELVPLPVVGAKVSRTPVTVEDEGEAGAFDSAVSCAAAGANADAGEALAAEMMVSAVARPLFVRLVERGLPRPMVGEDIEGAGGQVLGSPELSWSDARVAVLLGGQEGSRKALEAGGWACFAVGVDGAELDRLCDLVRRGGG